MDLPDGARSAPVVNASGLGGWAGQADADEFCIRSGQSAAAQHDTDIGRQWLRLALQTGNDPVLRATARHALAELAKPSSPADSQ